MKYKLVKFAFDKPITGGLLEELLNNEGFTVPVKVAMATVTAPVRPTSIQGSSPEAVTEWNRYTLDFKVYRDALYAAKAVYFKQFTDFAVRLSQEFVIVDAVTLVPASGYSYRQAADRLMGRYGFPITDPINFICYKTF